MSLNFIYFGLYTLFLVIVAGFFIIIRIHALKFKNFQTQIVTSLRALCIFLIILAIGGYISLYFIVNSGNITTVKSLEKAKNITDIKNTIDELQEEIY